MNIRAWAVLACVVLHAGCGDDEASTATPGETPDEEEVEAPPRSLRDVVGEDLFEALPEVEVERSERLLGRALFHDRRLSGDETISCSTCHMLSHGGAEPRAVSIGVRGATGPINAPTVLNAEANFRQFWDGRAADLLEQIESHIVSPPVMDGDWDTILERLGDDDELALQMTEAYGDDPITQANVLDAIVQYERYLSTPSSFDRWLGGEDDALSEEEQRGLRAFVETGCATCHLGRNVGGTMYRQMGVQHDYFERRGGRVTLADLGRFNASEEDDDRHFFKVPTLRMIEHTAPYFHDGSEPDLAGAVRTMSYVQLGEELDDARVDDITAFLRSLSGELPDDARPPEPGADDDDEEAEVPDE